MRCLRSIQKREFGTDLDNQGSSVNFRQIAEDSAVYQTLETYFAAATVERNDNAENARIEASEIRSLPSSDHSNLSDAEHSTYMFTKDEIVLSYSLDIASEFNLFIITRSHPLHRCRPLSKVWGRFLMASPDKDSGNLSAFVKEDVEEYAYFRASCCEGQTRSSNHFEIYKKRTMYFCQQSRIDTSNNCCSLILCHWYDLEDKERENGDCEVEDDHPKGR